MIKTRLIPICALAILLLIAGSTVKANQIIDLVDSSDEQDDTIFYPGGVTEGYLISYPDWGWTHTFSFDGPMPPSSITSATLEIKQYGVLMYDEHEIFLDGVSLGFLNNVPYETTYYTTFTLSSVDINNLLDGTADMWMDIDWPNSVAIYWSKLTINYIPSGLDHIEVEGPTQVNEDSVAQYTCRAYFIDGSSSDVTSSCSWSENSDFASIDSGGNLTTSSVSEDEFCQIKAAYGDLTDTYDITIKNVIPTVSISATTPLAAEPGINGIFGISRTGSTNEILRVYFSRSGSTATPGSDYMELVPTDHIEIASGQSSVPISVIVIDDTVEEATETVKLTLKTSASYFVDPVFSSATVTIDDDESGTYPETTGHIPDKDSVQVPRDTIIQLNITDGGSGVDYKGVTIEVEGDLIYDGANETTPGVYKTTSQTVNGICRRVETEKGYMFVFQASTLFDYEQKVDVKVNAKDKAGNVMPEEEYYFYTVMRTFGKNIKVNTDTGTFAQNHPDSATDSWGNLWVVWEHMVIGGDSDIYIGKLPAGGSAFESSQLVFGDLNNQLKPAIAIDGTEKIYVVWQGNDPTGNWDIFVSTSMNGSNWTSPVKVNVDALNESSQTSPSIAIDGDNQVYIAWEDNSAGNKDIWVATSTGTSPWALTQLTNDLNNQTEPVVKITGLFLDNTPYVFWIDEGDIDTDIFASKNDGSWSSPQLIVDTFSNQSSPSVAISNGTIHLLWVDDNNVIESIFYGNDAGGLPINGISIADEPGTYQCAPSITAHGTKVFACWQDSRNVLSNADTDIYYAENGVSDFGTNILVNDDIGTYTQTSPVINEDIYGNPFIVWVDNRKGNNDIYGAGVTSIGNILRSATVKTYVPTTQIVQINESTENIDDADDVKIEIPAGALPVDTEIRIAKLNNPPELPAGAFGTFYEFGPSGFKFNLPVTITIPHKAADCPGHSAYAVYFYDPTIPPPGLPWSRDGITNVEHLTVLQDPTLPSDVHVIRFKTDHFTAFGAGSSVPVASGGGGGGGGGCSVSAGCEGNIVEFLLPYLGFVIVLVILTVRDARVRKARGS